MKAKTPNQLPDALNGIEIGAVGRQEVEGETGGTRLPPFAMKLRMMVAGIVRYHHHPTASPSAGPFQLLEELPARLRIEALRFAALDEPTIVQTNGAKVTHALASRVVPEHGVAQLRWNPHATA